MSTCLNFQFCRNASQLYPEPLLCFERTLLFLSTEASITAFDRKWAVSRIL